MTKIALIGNPNSGKTTMFNDLTGSTQRVGNWPGVTVEKKEGKLKGHGDVKVVDLPGIYSLSPYSPEEVVSRDFLVKETPEAIINIVDATNLERNLYLTMQILDLGIPVVVALNMIDVVEKRGDTIDADGLAKCLGCDVVPTSALKGRGLRDIAEKAAAAAAVGKREPKKVLSPDFEAMIIEIGDIIGTSVEDEDRRWYSIKAVERDEKVIEELGDKWNAIEKIVSAYETKKDDDGESIVANERYDYIVKVVRRNLKKSDIEYVSTSDKIDRIVTNRWLALPIFALIIFAVYYISITTVGTLLTDWVNDVVFGEWIIPTVADFLEGADVSNWLSGLIVDGIISGVGAVLGFLPQMLVLFLMLVLLEQCGYMARIAFIMDRVFRRFGLSGKSFIPALIGTGCGIPGIMAARTIESESDRKITVMTTTFMPCSAKLPVIALIAGAIFNGNPWIAPATYFLGIAAILISGIILKKFRTFIGKPTPFIMELPEYRAPNPKMVAWQTGERGWAFVKKAGTLILLATILIWFLSAFNLNWDAGIVMVNMDDSALAWIGRNLEGIFVPLGFGNDWRFTVATITGLIAKENVVATFGILFEFAGEGLAEDGAEIWADVAAAFSSSSAALSFLLFNLLCAPCFAAIGAMRRELGTWKATGVAVTYQCLFAYAIAAIVYQFAVVFELGFEVERIPGLIFAVVLLAIFAFLLTRKEDTEEDSLFGNIVDSVRRIKE
jgi:ferrous iron transporter FeoB